jgi:hypothetical protein
MFFPLSARASQLRCCEAQATTTINVVCGGGQTLLLELQRVFACV